MQPGPPQRLVGVDVADAADQRLVQQRALDPGVPGAQPPGQAGRVEGRVQGVGGDVRDRPGEFGPVPHHAHVTERPLVGEAQVLTAVCERELDPDVRRERLVRVDHE